MGLLPHSGALQAGKPRDALASRFRLLRGEGEGLQQATSSLSYRQDLDGGVEGIFHFGGYRIRLAVMRYPPLYRDDGSRLWMEVDGDAGRVGFYEGQDAGIAMFYFEPVVKVEDGVGVVLRQVVV